jgi:hypothetical protein
VCLVERNAVVDEPSGRRLAGWLRPFGVRAQRGRYNGEPWRGYYRHDLDDSVRRYLTPLEEAARNGATRRDDEPPVEDRVGSRHVAPLTSGDPGLGLSPAGTDDAPVQPALALDDLDPEHGPVVDLPVGTVEVCRFCGLACVTLDRVGPVHPLCAEKERGA